MVCATANCVDSNSRAPICCPATKEPGCKATVNNCISRNNCGLSFDFCAQTANCVMTNTDDCIGHKTAVDECKTLFC